MKVFLDTNIFLEYFEQRREYKAVDRLLSAVEDGKLKAVMWKTVSSTSAPCRISATLSSPSI